MSENFETSQSRTNQYILLKEQSVPAARGKREGCGRGGKTDDQVRDQIAVIFLSIATLCFDEVIVWVKDTLVVVCV